MCDSKGLKGNSAMYTAKEEKHPLLVVVMDTDPEDDLMMGSMEGRIGPDGTGGGVTAKLKTIRTKGRKRARSLALGTVNIIKLWPDHLTTYTLTMALVALTIILLVNIFVHMGVAPGSDVIREMEVVKEACYKHKNMDLVLINSMYRPPDAFLYIYLNEGRDRLMNGVRRNLTELTRIYENFNVKTVMLRNDTAEYVADRRYKRRDDANLVNIHNKMGFHHYHPRPLSEFFEHSPFEKTWYKLSYEIIPFAVMVAGLWEHGGLSIDMEKFNKSINVDHAKKDAPENPLHVFDDNDFGLEPNSFTHFGNVPVNNIQDIIHYEKTDSSTPEGKILNSTNEVFKHDSSVPNESYKSNDSISLTQVWNKSAEVSSVQNDNTSIVRNLLSKLADDIFTESGVQNSSEIRTLKLEFEPNRPHVAHRRKRWRWQRRSQRFPFHKLPREDVAMIARDGLFISVRVPCHAFIGQLIQRMHLKTDYHSAKSVIEDALAVFCKRSDKTHGACEGVEVF